MNKFHLTPRELFFIALVVMTSLFLSIAFPLFTYATTLAIFGLAHVVCELRFVDQRFAERIDRKFAMLLSFVLMAIVVVRAGIVFKFLPINTAYNVELGLVFVLALLAQFFLPQKSSRITYVFIFALALGFIISPLATVLVLGVLHNVTPMGFIIEIAPSSSKKLVTFVTMISFIALPLLVASNILTPLVQFFITPQQDFTIFPTGVLQQHLSVFLPSSLRHSTNSLQLFSAVVFAQCMHYLAVLFVMPRLATRLIPKETMKPYISWPRSPLFWLALAMLTTVLVISYTKDFFWTRSFYGIAAALHAYLEIPILLWALSQKDPVVIQRKAAAPAFSD